VTVTVRGSEDEVSVSGTLFAGDDPRIVSIDGFRVDAIPHGHMMVARNRDEPGVIGFVGSVLGDHGVNIAGMFNARQTIGGEALTVYNLDDPAGDAVCEQLLADDRIIDVVAIELNGE
jgi:D-3-phosphoglycerate dehydrogenase